MFDINKTKIYANIIEKVIKEAWEDAEVRVGIDGNNLIFKHDNGEKYIVNCDIYVDKELKVDSDSSVAPYSVYFRRSGDMSATCRCGAGLGLEMDKCPQCNRSIDWGMYKNNK